MSRSSWNLGASNTSNLQGLSRPVYGFLYPWLLPPYCSYAQSFEITPVFHDPSREVFSPFMWVVSVVEASWKVMARTQKPDFVFRRNRRVYLNRRGRQFSRLLAARGVRISGSNAGYTMFRGSVKCTGYPLHSPVSPSLPLPVRHCVPSHLNWTLSVAHCLRIRLNVAVCNFTLYCF